MIDRKERKRLYMQRYKHGLKMQHHNNTIGRPEMHIVLTEEQQKLAARWVELLPFYCKGAVKRGMIDQCEYEELFGYLQYELCKAAFRYDGSKAHEENEWAFLKMVLKQRVFSFIKSQKSLRNTQPFQFPECNKGAYEDFIPARGGSVSVDRKALGDAIENAHLNEAAKSIMKKVLAGLSYAGIGEELHLSCERIRQIFQQGIIVLRESFAANNLHEDSFYEYVA